MVSVMFMTRAREGRAGTGGPNPYGYKSKDGQVWIVPEEAKVVRWIFDEYLKPGGSIRAIAAELKLDYAIGVKERLGDRSVRVRFPEIDCRGRRVVLVDDVAQLDGSASYDPDGEIVQYDWLFGEDLDSGITDGGPNPTWIYDAPGTYVVTLRIYDDDLVRVDDTTTAEIFEDNLPPVADANGPYTGEAGAPVAFDGTGSIDPDGTT